MARRKHNDTTKRMVAFINASKHPIPRDQWMSLFRGQNSATALLVAMGIVERGPGSGGNGRKFTEAHRAAALKVRQDKAAAKAEAKRLAKVEKLRKELEALEGPTSNIPDGASDLVHRTALPNGEVRRERQADRCLD